MLLPIMSDLNNDDDLFHIVKNKRSKMSWRHRCYGFNWDALMIMEEVQKIIIKMKKSRLMLIMDQFSTTN